MGSTRNGGTVAVVLAGALLVPGPAAAAIPALQLPSAHAVIGTSLIDSWWRPGPRPTFRQQRSLRFVPRAAVTARTNDALVPLLTAGDPDWYRVVVEREGIRGGEYALSFRGFVRRFGGSTRNLADGVAGYYLVSWLSVAQRAPSSEASAASAAQRAGGRRFLLGVRRVLARDPGLRRLSDGDQQQLFELLGAVAAHAWQVHEQQLEAGLTADAARTRAAIRAAVRQTTGVDVARLRLTARGLRGG